MWRGLGVVAALALSVSVGAALPVAAQGMLPGLADLAARLSPAVVNISTTHILKPGESAEEDDDGAPDDQQGGDQQNPDDQQGDEPDDVPDQGAPQDNAPAEKVQSLGSGFVIDEKGVIVTNNHVIDGADSIDVTFTDGTTLPAKLIGKDEKTDIAVLKVESKTPLAHVALGDSTKLRVGDWVVAIGNPFGLGGSVTAGIVSALNRDIHAGNYDDFIQTDAAINRGNSGGPLFNLAGEVVGMNTAIISPSGESVGIGFATPASTISSIVPQILTSGTIKRGWIGVRIQSVTPEIASSLGLKDLHGALIAGVTDGGPASKAGLETGDLVTTFDGHVVHEMRDLPRIVAETKIGRDVKVGVIRHGKLRQMSVKVGLLDETKSVTDKPALKAPLQVIKLKVLGLDLVAIDDATRAQFNIDKDVQGALIADVAPSSSAADKGVAPGDVILRVGQHDVTTPQEAVDQINAEKKAGATSVLLRLSNAGTARFVAVAMN